MQWKSMSVFLIAWAALLMWVLTGCADLYNTADQDVVENGDKKLYLSCTPDNINVDGGGSISVIVQVTYDNDTPVADGSVQVTSTLGTLAEAAIDTDEEGVGATTLTPGTETGTAIVVASHSTLVARCEVAFYQSGDNAE